MLSVEGASCIENDACSWCDVLNLRGEADPESEDAVRELLLEIKKELGVRRLKVCSTGGYAALVVQDLDPKIPVIEDLTLIGIGKIVERNS